MNTTLVNAIKDAVARNTIHIEEHLARTKGGDHTHIGAFQDGVCNALNKTPNMQSKWKCEKTASIEHKDSIDIYGDLDRPCLIEIDAVRHDQIAAKFVSRIALCGLDEPIDYVAVLYDSTQESGRQSAEKFIRYMYAILKKINPESSLIGIYVHVNKTSTLPQTTIKIWDCENQGYSIDTTSYKSMAECARGAIAYYMSKHRTTTFPQLQKVFQKKNGTSYVFNSAAAGKGHRAKAVQNITTSDGYPIFVDSQFRFKRGNHTNWLKFVEICKDNKIQIKQEFL